MAAGDQSTELAKQILGVRLRPRARCTSWCTSCGARGEGIGAIGLDGDRPAEDIRRGVVLFAIVGTLGVGVYLAAVALGRRTGSSCRCRPSGHWWTVPVLVLNAAEAALKEEMIVVAYLVTRLRQLGWSDRRRRRGQRAAPRLLPPVSGAGVGSRATSRWVCCSRGCSRWSAGMAVRDRALPARCGCRRRVHLVPGAPPRLLRQNGAVRP